MALKCIWMWGPISEDLGSGEYLFFAMTPRPTLHCVVVYVRVASMVQIDLFGLIGLFGLIANQPENCL